VNFVNLLRSNTRDKNFVLFDANANLVTVLRVLDAKRLNVSSPYNNIVCGPLQLDATIGDRTISDVEPFRSVRVEVNELSFGEDSVNGAKPLLLD